MLGPITTIDELEEALSRPTAAVLESLSRQSGDWMVLGAGGKMGPTLARMLRRGLDQVGQTATRCLAVSRFSSSTATESLHRFGVETHSCDLLDPSAVGQLPKVPNVLYLAGQKFGTKDQPELTWAMNTLVPANVARHFAHSKIVVFSTGCVYPLVPSDRGGASEDAPLTPAGEYANSCVGRERIFGYFAKENQTPMLYYRLSYAIDLRYGVLLDVAEKVAHSQPIDVTMGYANVIWQGDANARAIQCLERVDTPPVALNVTGLEPVSIRWLAEQFGLRFGIHPTLVGREASTAWLFDASKSYAWFGPPLVTIDEMIEATARWIQQKGVTHGKPTHFEVRSGDF